MRKLFLIAHLIFYFTLQKSNAQINLVPNPSFEDTLSCPTTLGQINYALPWFQPNIVGSSTDYFNNCSNSTSADVPSNYFGYQNAKTGASYTGINLMSGGANIDFAREYIEVGIDSALIANKKYCIHYYAVAANLTVWGINRIDAFFSLDSLQYNDINYGYIPVSPQFQNQEGVITDTLNWTLISGIYEAQGLEKFVTIGNFNAGATVLTDTFSGGSMAGAYYYIDDVSLIQLPDIDAGINDSINLGDSSQLNGTCTGCWAGLGYQWFPSVGLNDSTIINPMATPGQTTTYYFGLVDTTGTIPCMIDYVDSVTVYVCCVGINDLNDKNDLGIMYPNPANTTAYYEIELENEQTGFVQLFDILGNLVATQKLSSGINKAEFNLINLSNGIYIYKVTINNEYKTSNKLIITK